MVGVDTVYHLAGAEWRGTRESLMEVDIYGTRAVVEASKDAGSKTNYSISVILEQIGLRLILY